MSCLWLFLLSALFFETARAQCKITVVSPLEGSCFVIGGTPPQLGITWRNQEAAKSSDEVLITTVVPVNQFGAISGNLPAGLSVYPDSSFYGWRVPVTFWGGEAGGHLQIQVCNASRPAGSDDPCCGVSGTFRMGTQNYCDGDLTTILVVVSCTIAGVIFLVMVAICIHRYRKVKKEMEIQAETEERAAKARADARARRKANRKKRRQQEEEQDSEEEENLQDQDDRSDQA